MLHVGLDLSRRRLDVCVLDETGEALVTTAVSPDVGGLFGLTGSLERFGQPVRAAVESMNGARFVHDTLERAGWDVLLADAQKVKGLAPLACKTDRIDAWVLAELCRRALVPEVWLPTFEVRGERERARWRLHLVAHRTALKNRIHATLMAFGHPCPMSDLFGVAGRELLARLDLPDPWAEHVLVAIALIDTLDDQVSACERELRRLGANHPYMPLLRTIPGVGWVLAYTIAAEIGDITRFPTPTKLCGYTGLCPKVEQSGERDRRGSLSRHGPRYLRWALMEATIHASHHPAYRTHYEATKARLGRYRGPKIARVEVARRLAHAIWHMCTRSQPFAPHRAA